MMDELRILVPPELSAELTRIADSRGVKVVELMRQFIKLGMLAAMIEEDPNSALVIRQVDGIDQELLLI